MNGVIAGSSPVKVKGMVKVYFVVGIFNSLGVRIYGCQSEGPGSGIC